MAAGTCAAVVFDDHLLRFKMSNSLPLLPEAPISITVLTRLLAGLSVVTLRAHQGMPPPPVPTTRTIVPRFPRAEALKSTAETPEAFFSFLTAVLPWFVEPSRLLAVKAHELTQLSTLENWLKLSGDRTDPTRLRAAEKWSEAELINFALQLLDAALKANAVVQTGSGGANSNSSAASTMVTHQVIQPDRDGSETERLERVNLAYNAQQLMEKPELQEKVKSLAALARSSDYSGLFDLAASAEIRTSALYPLISTAEDINKAISGHLSQPLQLEVSVVRGALARRIELAFCESEVQPSARVRGALHMVRIGRLRKLKLLYLLDMEDCDTPDDPLKQFALLK